MTMLRKARISIYKKIILIERRDEILKVAKYVWIALLALGEKLHESNNSDSSLYFSSTHHLRLLCPILISTY